MGLARGAQPVVVGVEKAVEQGGDEVVEFVEVGGPQHGFCVEEGRGGVAAEGCVCL